MSSDIQGTLDITQRRARETILEGTRIGLIESVGDSEKEPYQVTDLGVQVIEAAQNENWASIHEILCSCSPHYAEFISILSEDNGVNRSELVRRLEQRSKWNSLTFNETSIDVLSDWAQRLNVVQRNAFTGTLYLVSRKEIPDSFVDQLVTTMGDLEETRGVNLRQRYISIPEIREMVCEDLYMTRPVFDESLVRLAKQNIGRLELSGAPIDTEAKDARYGIKTMRFSDDQGIVSAEHDSARLMKGVEWAGKNYYYVTIHEEPLRFDLQ